MAENASTFRQVMGGGGGVGRRGDGYLKSVSKCKSGEGVKN